MLLEFDMIKKSAHLFEFVIKINTIKETSSEQLNKFYFCSFSFLLSIDVVTILALNASGCLSLNQSSKTSKGISKIRSRQNSTDDITSGDKSSQILLEFFKIIYKLKM
jgi:hypothetical protein